MKTSALVGALAALGMAYAPTAAADSAFYLDEVHTKTNLGLSDAQLMQLGQIACDAMRSGVSSGLSFGSARSKADDAVAKAIDEMGVLQGIPNVVFLVEAAEHQLC